MSQMNPTQLFKQATEDLERASNELYRPAEDVVSFSACVSSRRALYRYLYGLALLHAEQNNIMLEPDLKIEQLITFCSRYSAKLKKIDFSSLNCKCTDVLKDGEEEIVYCTSVEKVNYCAGLAEDVKEIVAEMLK